MKRVLLLLAVILAIISGILLTRSAKSTAAMFPACGEVKNEHYTGPCVTYMVDGVITGD